MIKTFAHRGLSDLWSTRRTAEIDKRMHLRILIRLTALDVTTDLEALAVTPGFGFHPLRGFTPTRYALSVNGPWRITFEFDAGDVYRVDFEQYH